MPRLCSFASSATPRPARSLRRDSYSKACNSAKNQTPLFTTFTTLCSSWGIEPMGMPRAYGRAEMRKRRQRCGTAARGAKCSPDEGSQESLSCVLDPTPLTWERCLCSASSRVRCPVVRWKPGRSSSRALPHIPFPREATPFDARQGEVVWKVNHPPAPLSLAHPVGQGQVWCLVVVL